MDSKTNKILNSLNGFQKVSAPDFFYTRLHAKMQHGIQTKSAPFFLLNPAFATSLFFILLAVNIFSVVKFNTTSAQKKLIQINTAPSLQSFAEAYNFNTEIVYK